MYISPIVSRKTLFLDVFISHFLFHRAPRGWIGRNVKNTSNLGPGASESLTFCTLSSCVSMLAATYCEKNILWCGFCDPLTYGYNSLSLGVVLLLCFCSRVVDAVAPLEPKAFLASGSQPHWQYKIRVPSYFHDLRVTIAPMGISYKQVTILAYRTCYWGKSNAYFPHRAACLAASSTLEAGQWCFQFSTSLISPCLTP